MIRSFKLFEVLDHQVAVCWLGRPPIGNGFFHDEYCIALRTFHDFYECEVRIWFSDKEVALRLLREGDDVLQRRCIVFVEGLKLPNPDAE